MIYKREGSSWLELVVIVFLLLIVAAIVFPIFARCPQPSLQAKCVNNLKQISSATMMYEDDYDGMVLPWSIGKPGKKRTWTNLLAPYMRQLGKKHPTGMTTFIESVYRCPGAPDEVRAVQDEQHGRDYGYNPYLDKTVTVKKVKYPSLTLRVTESAVYDYDMHNLPRGVKDARYRGGCVFAPMPRGRFKDRVRNPQAPGWHVGHNDVLWFDGHVSSITWQRVMYTNRYQGTTDPNVWCRLSPKEGILPD